MAKHPAFDELEEEGEALLTLFKWFTTRNFGAPCPDFDEDCATCKMWKMHDSLTKILKS